MQNFLTSNLITSVATAAATVTTEVVTSAVDMAGYDRVVFVRSVSAARICQLRGGTTTTATVDITGASVTATAGQVVSIEIHRPQYRYILMAVQSGVTAVCGDAIAIQGLARSKPISNTGSAIVTTTTD